MGEAWGHRRSGSPDGAPIRVRRIRGTTCYQIVDGHHRGAQTALVDADATIAVRVERPSVRTPLQIHLLAMSWLAGRPELYQPVAELDVEGWPLVRACTDRMGMIEEHLATLDIDPATSTYLDVAACYGWFVAQMRDRGFCASGIELDPLAPSLGSALYGLDESVIHTGEAVALLEAMTPVRFTVVSCFSLLHHFVLGRAEHSPEQLLEHLDGATERILYFDMGQATERWFRRSMSEWTPDHIEAWLRQHSSFDSVVRLGVDSDDHAPFEDNYGRTLFALTRA